MSVLLVEASTQLKPPRPTSQPPSPAVESVRVYRPVRTFLAFLIADVLAVVVALFSGGALRNALEHTRATPVAGTILPALLINLAVFTVAGLYPGVCINPVEELRRCFAGGRGGAARSPSSATAKPDSC